jgi:dolichol-phosphate mannosyltransferase
MDSNETRLPARGNTGDSSANISRRPASLALVIPTLREAGNIEPLLRRVRIALDSCAVAYEVIVVDDESEDGIEQIVAGISAGDPRVRLIVRHGERGLAGAVLRGWAETGAKYLAVMDADLQHPPELLPQLWAEMQAGADLAVCSRYASGGCLGGWKTWRHLISRAAIWMTLRVQRSGLRALDPMSGFFMVRRACIEHVKLQKAGFKILLEILARADLHNVVEVPFTFGRRYAGASKASPRVAFDYLLLLLRLYRWNVRTPANREHDSVRGAVDIPHEVIGN